jgi:hypothetical protein
MRINGYRCDHCNKEHLIPNTSIASMREGVPFNWFLVYHGEDMGNKEPWLFCSDGCLRAWAEKKIEPKEALV